MHSFSLRALGLALSCVAIQAQDLYVIFDAGGVLINTNSGSAFREMGYGTVAHVALQNIAKLHVFKNYVRYDLLFKFLTAIEPYEKDEIISLDPLGFRLPQIMCSWLKGKKNHEQFLKKIEDGLQDIACDFCFKNDAEKQLVRAMATMMFTPEIFAKTQQLDPAMKACALACHEQGLKLCLHSAWDAASFELIKQQDPEFWQLFEDRIFLSGNTGLLKPDSRSYTFIVRALHCNPEDCAFIDDVWSNVQAANDVGMFGIHYRSQSSLWPWIKNRGIERVEKQLKIWISEHSGTDRKRASQRTKNKISV